jgi:hypothetical protein
MLLLLTFSYSIGLPIKGRESIQDQFSFGCMHCIECIDIGTTIILVTFHNIFASADNKKRFKYESADLSPSTVSETK